MLYMQQSLRCIHVVLTTEGKDCIRTAFAVFMPIEKAYPALEAEFHRLELDKNLSVERRNAEIASLILVWGG